MAKNLQCSGGRRNTGPGAHSLRLACTQGLPPNFRVNWPPFGGLGPDPSTFYRGIFPIILAI